MTVCLCHATYALQSEFTLYNCLNVKELLTESRWKIWRLNNCNWTRTQNHLVRVQLPSIKSFVNNFNWEKIEFPVGPKDWEQFERNNKTIALNLLFLPKNSKTITVAYRLEYNHKPKNQVILLMITNGENDFILLYLIYLHCFKESHHITTKIFFV